MAACMGVYPRTNKVCVLLRSQGTLLSKRLAMMPRLVEFHAVPAQVSFFLNLSSSAFAMFVLRSLYLEPWTEFTIVSEGRGAPSVEVMSAHAVANPQIDHCSRCKGSRPADAHVPLPSVACCKGLNTSVSFVVEFHCGAWDLSVLLQRVFIHGLEGEEGDKIRPFKARWMYVRTENICTAFRIGWRMRMPNQTSKNLTASCAIHLTHRNHRNNETHNSSTYYSHTRHFNTKELEEAGAVHFPWDFSGTPRRGVGDSTSLNRPY